ncbi:MAG: hypothetical protein ABI372_10715 [Ginsengibacter sp.]
MRSYRTIKICLVSIFVIFSMGSIAQKASTVININHFDIIENNNNININWSTDNKIPTNYFEVEKSNDGKYFKVIAYVLGADPSKSDCDCYGYFDKIDSKYKKSYYRLKHIDKNGLIEFSEVKLLAINNK